MAQLTIPLDAKRFATGLTWKDYMAQMGDTKPRTEANYQHATLTDQQRQFFGSVTQVQYRADARGQLVRRRPLQLAAAGAPVSGGGAAGGAGGAENGRSVNWAFITLTLHLSRPFTGDCTTGPHLPHARDNFFPCGVRMLMFQSRHARRRSPR
jgi:hypothetical protein